MKNFPIRVLNILPAITILGVLSGCHASTTTVEANTAWNPVVAPAGTVLRVRLSTTLDSGRSRPGDRFSGVLDAPVTVGTMEILAKGTVVEGHVLTAHGIQGAGDGAVLALTLDCYEREGQRYAVSTSAVTWTGRNADPLTPESKRVSVPAESIMGFTLKSTLTAYEVRIENERGIA